MPTGLPPDDTDCNGPGAEAGAEERPTTSPLGRILSWFRRHPLLTVALWASAVAVGHAVWIWTHRYRGAYDPDEAGYIASALRMERRLSSLDLVGFLVAVGGTGNGVVVPLLSVPLVMMGPRDPRTVMMIQPILLVLTSVAVAGITRRVSGPRAALAAGLLCSVMPMMATGTLSYWYGLGATACLAGSIWALVSSDRGANRWIWWFGVGLGAMALTRTMTLGYIPGLALAGAVLAGWDRRRLMRTAGAVALGLAIAAPWYLLNFSTTFDYLFSYGYGERAARFGSGNVFERTRFRFVRIEEAFGQPAFRLLWASALCVAVLVAVRVWRAGVTPRVRAGLAVLTCFALGIAALVSTSNNGVWFELPMAALAVVLLVATISAGPTWYSAGLAAVIAVVSIVGLGGHWWLLPYDQARLPSHYEFGFLEYDERFGPRTRELHPEAAREWDELNRAVIDAVRPDEPGDDDPVFTVSGNMQLFNTNSLALTGELEGWTPTTRVPDTADAPEDRARELTPTFEHDGVEVERIVLLARHDRILFTPDADVEEFAEQAHDAGWRVERRIRMPNGGEVEILRHPDGARG